MKLPKPNEKSIVVILISKKNAQEQPIKGLETVINQVLSDQGSSFKIELDEDETDLLFYAERN